MASQTTRLLTCPRLIGAALASMIGCMLILRHPGEAMAGTIASADRGASGPAQASPTRVGSPPDITVSPLSFSADLFTGGRTSQNLRIGNSQSGQSSAPVAALSDPLPYPLSPAGAATSHRPAQTSPHRRRTRSVAPATPTGPRRSGSSSTRTTTTALQAITTSTSRSSLLDCPIPPITATRSGSGTRSSARLGIS